MKVAHAPTFSETPVCKSLSVLLVEDSRAMRKIVASFLRSRGHSVTLAQGGPDLLDTYVAGHFDVILMDIEMPGMDGHQTAAAIRQIESKHGVRTPIVALTAHLLEEDRHKCIQSGMDACISKPIDIDRLLAVIEGDSLRRRAAQCLDNSHGDVHDGATTMPVDLLAMMRRLGGDVELVRQFILVFEEDSPQLLESILASVTDRDVPALRRAAHALRGLAANFEAKTVVEMARRLERAGIDEPLEHLMDVPPSLASEVGRMRKALSLYRP